MFIHNSAEVSPDAEIAEGVMVWNQVQVREGARIGAYTILSKNVYIDYGVVIGRNCKIQNNVSVYHGVRLADGIFVGPHVCFTNDRVPRAINPDGSRKSLDDWVIVPTLVKAGASIGAHSVILPGITIGEFGMVGAGSVITRDVPPHTLVLGNPGRAVARVCACGKRLPLDTEEGLCPDCAIKYKESI